MNNVFIEAYLYEANDKNQVNDEPFGIDSSNWLNLDEIRKANWKRRSFRRYLFMPSDAASFLLSVWSCVSDPYVGEYIQRMILKRMF